MYWKGSDRNWVHIIFLNRKAHSAIEINRRKQKIKSKIKTHFTYVSGKCNYSVVSKGGNKGENWSRVKLKCFSNIPSA